MNAQQRKYIIFVQDKNNKELVHIRRNAHFYVGFAKARADRSISRYASLQRKFEIVNNELAGIKQKYPDFSLTWFGHFGTKYYARVMFTTFGSTMK